MKLFTDAAVNGKDGQAGIGFVFQANEIYEQIARPLEGEWDNHTAEFEAAFQAIEWMQASHFSDSFVFLYTDSKIVAESIQKKYAKNHIFSQYTHKICDLLSTFEFYEVQWIPSSKNKGADHLARQGLQMALKKKKNREEKQSR